jgi:hypothetical protein
MQLDGRMGKVRIRRKSELRLDFAVDKGKCTWGQWRKGGRGQTLGDGVTVAVARAHGR